MLFSCRAVGVMADLLNKSEDAEIFYNHSKNYKNVWNKERELMCPRSKSGEFHCPFDPTLNTWIIKDAGFTEGEHDGMQPYLMKGHTVSTFSIWALYIV